MWDSCLEPKPMCVWKKANHSSLFSPVHSGSLPNFSICSFLQKEVHKVGFFVAYGHQTGKIILLNFQAWQN